MLDRSNSTPFPAAPLVKPTIPQKAIERYQIEIKATWGKSVFGIIETAKLLNHLKEKVVRHGDWERLFEGPKAPFSSRMARMLIDIAKNPAAPVLCDRNHGSDLPASWRTLSVLSALPAKRLRQFIRNKTVHPELKRAEAEAILKREDSRKRQANKVLEAKDQRHSRHTVEAEFLKKSPKPAPPKVNAYDTVNQLKVLLIDLLKVSDEIRKKSGLRKTVRDVVDKIFAIVDDNPLAVSSRD